MLNVQPPFDFLELEDQDFDPLYDDGAAYDEYEAGMCCSSFNRIDQFE